MARSQAEAETRRAMILPGGGSVSHLPSLTKALIGGGYTFPNTITLPYRGHTLTFEAGAFYQVDPPLLAYLAANGITPTVY